MTTKIVFCPICEDDMAEVIEDETSKEVYVYCSMCNCTIIPHGAKSIENAVERLELEYSEDTLYDD